MQLTYRGNKYQSMNPTVSNVSGELIVKYRGATVNTQHQVAAPSPSLNLVYRGIPYDL